MKFVRDVQEFHDKFKIGYDGNPRPILDEELMSLRLRRLREEVDEYAEAMALKDTAAVLDALIDLIYIAAGSVDLHGLTHVFEEGWERVHEANLKKERAAPDGSDSKHGSGFDIVKPQDWRAPDLADLVARPAPARCVACGTSVGEAMSPRLCLRCRQPFCDVCSLDLWTNGGVDRLVVECVYVCHECLEEYDRFTGGAR
jgi:hypothetical protein